MQTEKLNGCLLGIILAGSIFCLAGCSKKQPQANSTTSTEAAADSAAPANTSAAGNAQGAGTDKIPGEQDVRAALARKEYNVAVERLIAMKDLVASPEQRDEYGALFGEVRSELTDAAATNAKAAEALMTLRASRQGR